MKKNMGVADRIIRLIFGVVVVYLYFVGILSGLVGVVLLVISIVFILTSVVGICPLYAMLGINSFRRPRNKKGSYQ